MTVGYLLDLLIINEVRKEKLAAELDENNYATFYIYDEQGALSKVKKEILRLGPTNYSTLILGESGTGKELVANALHQKSTRNEKPFITVNFAGKESNLIESELFGHKKGAFTGAGEDRKGYFESANKGTIFLDEIGETPLETQV